MASNIPEVEISFQPIYDMVIHSPLYNMLMSSSDRVPQHIRQTKMVHARSQSTDAIL